MTGGFLSRFSLYIFKVVLLSVAQLSGLITELNKYHESVFMC